MTTQFLDDSGMRHDIAAHGDSLQRQWAQMQFAAFEIAVIIVAQCVSG